MARATHITDIKVELMRLNLVYHHYLTANVNAIACLDALSGKMINSIVESGQISQFCLQLMSQDPSDETLVKEEPAIEVPPLKELCKYCKDCRWVLLLRNPKF